MWSRIFYDSSGKGWPSGDRYRSDTGYDQKCPVFWHKKKQADCEFTVMDAENPEFPDDTFDVIISRNLTWTLPHVTSRLSESGSVYLGKGGVLLNFDANYGITDFSNVEDLAGKSCPQYAWKRDDA